ncbi:tetratricopeptide repeat protein [Pseudomonas schmalbachii]|uniref:Sel1 repeat family protein n=1 Tax=Pseudomonas schmalbachii TaxID=2816993 RepID=A0ABS3TNI3_9PSED|nr:tetratricopeptide repeat protein [Pseudomonas schmalbachii]MBO3275217.1 sel1 repeat family protein [Pseudomonas schmalbachii]
MFRSGRTLILGCLMLVPLLAQAGGNTLLIPATGRCTLNTVPEQLQQALATCQQIANGGDAQAQYELGEFFYSGERAPRDFKAAVHWFEKASLQGHANAQLRLGTMFFRGEGVKASNVQAYIVLKMAAVNGAEDAMDSADLVAEQMNKDELDIATRVLGQIFRNYLIELQTAGNTPFAPLP